MKKRLLVLAVPVLLAGCTVGPGPLHNKVYDWHEQNYEDEPFLTGVLTDVIPVYPIISFVAWIPDWLVFNTVQFWGTDVWAKTGATYKHPNTKGQPITPWYDK